MGEILGGLLGGKPKASPTPTITTREPVKTKVDPNLGEGLAAAKRRRQQAASSAGRSNLRVDLSAPSQSGRTGLSLSS